MSSHHRQILKSSFLVGGSSAAAMALGVVKVKVLALLLGPAGVGVMGLYQNILGVATTLFGCGLGTSGVRQVAASDDPAHRALVRRALWWGSLTLGALAVALLWLARAPLSEWVFGDERHAADVGLLGIGVLLSLVAASQTAILQGLLRIADLARVNVLGAVGGTIAGILCAWLWGHAGIVWFVITAPLFSAAAGAFFLRRVPAPPLQAASPAEVRAHLRTLLRLGLPFMLSMLVTMGTQLLARSLVLRELGMDAAGHFQAAWQISMVYIGFVLQAMSMDYYPRLTAALAESPEAARRLMADQTEMALLMAIPPLLFIMATAPWLMQVLYSSDFSPAISLLQLQTIGNILKVASWPMGYLLLAQNRGGHFFMVEFVWDTSFLAFLFVFLPHLGLDAVGFGFILSYAIILLMVISFSRTISFRLQGKWILWGTLALGICAVLLAVSRISHIYALLAGFIPTAAFFLFSLKRIDQHVGIRNWLKTKIHAKKVSP